MQKTLDDSFAPPGSAGLLGTTREQSQSVRPGASAGSLAGTGSLSRHPDIARTAVDLIFLACHRLNPRSPMAALRGEMILCIEDCEALDRYKLLRSILRASDGMDLWLLRIDLFQCISRQCGQKEARRRINAMRPSFAQWVPKPMLMEV